MPTPVADSPFSSQVPLSASTMPASHSSSRRSATPTARRRVASSSCLAATVLSASACPASTLRCRSRNNSATHYRLKTVATVRTNADALQRPGEVQPLPCLVFARPADLLGGQFDLLPGSERISASRSATLDQFDQVLERCLHKSKQAAGCRAHVRRCGVDLHVGSRKLVADTRDIGRGFRQAVRYGSNIGERARASQPACIDVVVAFQRRGEGVGCFAAQRRTMPCPRFVAATPAGGGHLIVGDIDRGAKCA